VPARRHHDGGAILPVPRRQSNCIAPCADNVNEFRGMGRSMVVHLRAPPSAIPARPGGCQPRNRRRPHSGRAR